MPAEMKTASDVASYVQGQVDGDGSVIVSGVSSIEDAVDGDLVFAESPRYLALAKRSKATVVVAPLDAEYDGQTLIRVDNPRVAFTSILTLFAPESDFSPGVDPSASVGENVMLGSDVSIGANSVIGAGSVIGDRVVIAPGAVLGRNCQVGADTQIHSNATLYAGTIIGERAIIHSGVVIGADGFGYVMIGSKRHKVPQIGYVQICEDVEIGANSTIDRAKTGATVIGARTKIDNLVHIGHNCKIGEDCVIVAQVGISGSVVMGNGVIVAGQAGINPGVKVGDRAMILGKAGCWSNVEAGAVLSGNPAKPHKTRLRQLAATNDLPEALTRLRQVEKTLLSLQERTGESPNSDAIPANKEAE